MNNQTQTQDQKSSNTNSSSLQNPVIIEHEQKTREYLADKANRAYDDLVLKYGLKPREELTPLDITDVSPIDSTDQSSKPPVQPTNINLTNPNPNVNINPQVNTYPQFQPPVNNNQQPIQQPGNYQRPNPSTFNNNINNFAQQPPINQQYYTNQYGMQNSSQLPSYSQNPNLYPPFSPQNQQVRNNFIPQNQNPFPNVNPANLVPGKIYYDEYGRPIQVVRNAPPPTSNAIANPQAYQQAYPQNFTPSMVTPQMPTQNLPLNNNIRPNITSPIAPNIPLKNNNPNLSPNINNQNLANINLTNSNPLNPTQNVLTSQKVEQGGSTIESSKPQELDVKVEMQKETDKVNELVGVLKEEKQISDNNNSKDIIIEKKDDSKPANSTTDIKVNGYPIANTIFAKISKSSNGKNLWRMVDSSNAKSWMYALASKLAMMQKERN